MNYMKLKVPAFAIMLFCCSFAAAQDDGYLMELGLGGGGSFYMGDANDRLYRNTNGVFSVMARYNVNSRFALKANLSAAGISGSSKNAFGMIPVMKSSSAVRYMTWVFRWSGASADTE